MSDSRRAGRRRRKPAQPLAERLRLTVPRPFGRHLVPLALLLAAPGLAVVWIAAFAGALSLSWAFGGSLLAVATGWGVAWAGLRALGRVGLYIETITTDPDTVTRPPHIWGFGAARDLARMALETGRGFAAARRRLASHLRITESILAGLPEPLLIVDSSRRITLMNDAARRLSGRDATGRTIATVLRDAGLLEAIDAAIDHGEGDDVEFETRVPVHRWLRAFVHPLDDEGAGRSAVLLLQDQSHAKRVDRMRVDFVANVSHELRTPLTSLLGFIETLRGPAHEDADARTRFLEIMQEQTERMARMVEDLMSLSRIELEEHEPPTGAVAVVPMVQGLVEALQVQAGQRRMRFALDLGAPGAEASSVTVPGDRDQLTQVFQNLLDNAVKYGREGTPVEIAIGHARRDPSEAGPGDGGEAEDGPRDYLRVAVSDHGEGISPEHLERLTERFYRVDAARSRKLGGTGLGLAIVKHILNRHGGLLEIESVPGKGSTFAVFLPVSSPAGAPS